MNIQVAAVQKLIDELEAKIAEYKARETWMDAHVYYAEWTDEEGNRAALQPSDSGFFDTDTHGEHFSFTEFIDQEAKL